MLAASEILSMSPEPKGGMITTFCQSLDQELSLAKTRLDYIGGEGAMEWADVLKNDSTLHRPNLYINHIGDEGATALAKALKSNSALQTLGLDSNGIGDRVS